MAVELAPGSAIIPIVRSTRENPVIEILGTGFFLGDDHILHVVTAKHVFENNPLMPDEGYSLVFSEKNGIKIVPLSVVYQCKDFDIAYCEITRKDLPEAVPLKIGSFEPSLNIDVFCYEYSSTRIERNPSGHTNITFEPNTHKGNIVRPYVSSFPEKINTPSYLLSFPALQGASGAPVLTATPSKNDFAVVGMIVANVETNLIPAQTLSIVDGDRYIEETKYFLPYGKAIARPVLADTLKSAGIPFQFTE